MKSNQIILFLNSEGMKHLDIPVRGFYNGFGVLTMPRDTFHYILAVNGCHIEKDEVYTANSNEMAIGYFEKSNV